MRMECTQITILGELFDNNRSIWIRQKKVIDYLNAREKSIASLVRAAIHHIAYDDSK